MSNYQLTGGASPATARPAGVYGSLAEAMHAFQPAWDAAWVELDGQRLAEFAWWQDDTTGAWVSGWRILPAGQGHLGGQDA